MIPNQDVSWQPQWHKSYTGLTQVVAIMGSTNQAMQKHVGPGKELWWSLFLFLSPPNASKACKGNTTL